MAFLDNLRAAMVEARPQIAIPSSSEAVKRKITDETISVTDEIIGVAIRAGSTPTLFAAMGSVPPSSLANMTTRIMAMATVSPITGGC